VVRPNDDVNWKWLEAVMGDGMLSAEGVQGAQAEATKLVSTTLTLTTHHLQNGNRRCQGNLDEEVGGEDQEEPEEGVVVVWWVRGEARNGGVRVGERRRGLRRQHW
jgi:hypothetical protein